MTLPALQEIFPDCIIGLSDHTMDIGAAIASLALEATVIEKHFTLNRSDGSIDSILVWYPLVTETQRAFLALENVQLIVQEAQKSLAVKHSIYVVNEVNTSEVFTKDCIQSIRPGDDLESKLHNNILVESQLKFNQRHSFQLNFDK